MNALLEKLSIKNTALYNHYLDTHKEVKLLLDKFATNFPNYTDHSISHTEEVLNLASLLLTSDEIENLNDDELYILSTACILHDVGMCIPPERIEELCEFDEYKAYVIKYKDKSLENYLRDIHHELSYNFIMKEYELLKIPTLKYAEGIALIAKAHRKVELQNFDEFDPRYFAKSGRQSVCLPYLGCIIRIADELDVTNMRTPSLLLKYYLPDNEISIREFKKHQSLTQINFKDDAVIIEAICTDHNILGAIEEQFQKIQDVISNCQKVIRSVSNLDGKKFSLSISKLEPKYVYQNFDPKGIKYSFDVKNVITAFVGKDLYGDYKAALREGVQNAVDACNYRKSIDQNYLPKLEIFVDADEIRISDNGHGMDEFIIENYFGKLASSFYERSNVKNAFEAIGQFGIGVFSYFLIADYIEVETKNQAGKSLKFRTDQDPSGYFHFFDGHNKALQGTILKMHLKSEFIKKINYSTVEDFIRKNFPYIAINIELSDENTTDLIKPSLFTLNYENDAVPKMYHSAYESKSQLSLLTFNYSDCNVEGEVGIIVPSNKKKYPSRVDDFFNRENFITRRHSVASEVKVSQKGVYVNKYSNALNFLIGNINIKSKLNINLNREGFRDEEDLIPIFNIFEVGLIEKFYTIYLNSLKITSKKEISIISDWFVRNILQSLWYLESNGIEMVTKYVMLEVLVEGKNTFLTINEIKELNRNVLILKERQAYNDQFKNFIALRDEDSDYILILQNTMKYGLGNIYVDDQNYYILDKQYFEHNREVSQKLGELSIFKSPIYDPSNKIIVHRNSSDDDEQYFSARFNTNSLFSKYIIDNFVEFSTNSTNKKILKEVLDEIEGRLLRLGGVTDSRFVKNINVLWEKLDLRSTREKFIFKKSYF